MGKDFSFDIVSNVDIQEVVNAIENSMREINNRYDFKNTDTEIHLNKDSKEILITTIDEYKAKAALDVLKNKLSKRGLPLKAFNADEPKESGLNKVIMKITIQDGIPIEKAKEIVKFIKDLKLKKVQASINKNIVRVSGPKKDDLQKIISFLKEKDFGIDMQFTNYR